MTESSIVIKNYIYEEFYKKNMEMLCYKVKCKRKNGTIYHFNQMKKA